MNKRQKQTHRLLTEGYTHVWDSDDFDWSSAKCEDEDPLAEWNIIPDGVTSMAYWHTLPYEKKVEVNRGAVFHRVALFAYGEALTVRVCEALLARRHGQEDERQYLTQQREEERRHTEVFGRYLQHTFPKHKVFPLNESLRDLSNLLLWETDTWYCRLLGMNVLEAIAHAAFTGLSGVATDPLLLQVLKRVRDDEARHVAFGRLPLNDIVPALSVAKYDELRVFAKDAIELARGRHFPRDIYTSLEKFAPSTDKLGEIETAYAAGAQRAAFQEKLMSGVRKTLEPLGLMPDDL